VTVRSSASQPLPDRKNPTWPHPTFELSKSYCGQDGHPIQTYCNLNKLLDFGNKKSFNSNSQLLYLAIILISALSESRLQ
jgi:hypothetical protein